MKRNLYLLLSAALLLLSACKQEKPQTVAGDATEITTNSAVISGESHPVTSQEPGFLVHGIRYSRKPDMTDYFVVEGGVLLFGPKFTVKLENLRDNTTYYYCPYVEDIDNNTSITGAVKSFKTLAEVHEIIDLGLSVKWRNRNVGAEKAEDSGDYFAWAVNRPYYRNGEAQSQSPNWEYNRKGGYDLTSYPFANTAEEKLTKYCTDADYGPLDGIDTIEKADDPAFFALGQDWRVPIRQEWDELLSECDWEWDRFRKGYVVKSRREGYKNDELFLPAAGGREGTSLVEQGNCAFYWTASLNSDFPFNAWHLYFDSDGREIHNFDRCYGCSVRPVCK